MIAALGLSGRQMREMELYAAIEPVGEGMVDYAASDKTREGLESDESTVKRLKALADKQQAEREH